MWRYLSGTKYFLPPMNRTVMLIFCWLLTQSRYFVFPLHFPFFHCWHLICIYIFLTLNIFFDGCSKEIWGLFFQLFKSNTCWPCAWMTFHNAFWIQRIECHVVSAWDSVLLDEGCNISHAKFIHILYFHCSMVPHSQKIMNKEWMKVLSCQVSTSC